MGKTAVNWGVLGCAKIADNAVIPGIKKADNAILYAISSRSRDKLEEFKNRHNPVKTYLSYDEMLDDPEIDAVYIPLPNGMHYEWTLKAAEKKKHILCEKPLGASPQEVLEMKAACGKYGVKLMEAFAFRHSPLTLKVKSLIDEGVIGRVKFIDSHFSFPLDNMNDVRLIRDLAGGSTFDVGCYNTSIIRFLAGSEPISVLASGDTGSQSGVDESSCAVLEFKDGLRALSFCSFKCAYRSEYTVLGETGMIKVPVSFNAKGNVKIFIVKGGSVQELTIDCPDNYMLEVEQFGRCILNGEKPLVSLDESYGNAVVINEVLKQVRHIL